MRQRAWTIPRYRIHLARDGENLIVLFGGGTKRRQQRDINRAKELLAEYKSRKAKLKKETPGSTSEKEGMMVVSRLRSLLAARGSVQPTRWLVRKAHA